MNTEQHVGVLVFVISVVLSLLVSGVVLWFGKGLEKYAKWLFVICLFVLLGSNGFCYFNNQTINTLEPVFFNWLKLVEGSLNISVGFNFDSVSFAMTLLSVFLTALIFLNDSWDTDKNEVKKYGSALLACTGLVISWASATPWLIYFGLIQVILAGFLWIEIKENALFFLPERLVGLLLILSGSLALVSKGMDLSFFSQGSISGVTRSASIVIGQALLIFGAFLFCCPLPLAKNLEKSVKKITPDVVLIGLLYPFWSGMAVLVRLSNQISDSSILQGIGIIALLSSILLGVSGFFSADLKKAYFRLVCCSFGIGFALLAWVGTGAGFSYVLAAGLGAVGLSYIDYKATSKKSLTLDVPRLIGAGSISGAVGTVGYLGISRIFSIDIEVGVMFGLFVLSFGVLSLLVWSFFWRTLEFASFRRNAVEKAGTSFLLFTSVLSLSWSGTITYGLFGNDTIYTGAILESFGVMAKSIENEGGTNPGFIFSYFSILLFSIGFSFWLWNPSRDFLGRSQSRFPRTLKTIEEFYFFEKGSKLLHRLVLISGEKGLLFLQDYVWRVFFPEMFSWVKRWPIGILSRGQAEISNKILKGFSGSVNVSSRALQYFCNGDVQDYVVGAMLVLFGLTILFIKL